MTDLTLLTGATGFVGSAVARALAARGHLLRVLARPGSDRRNLAGLDCTVAEGDLRDPASLTRAAAGCRYVVHVAADYRIWVPDAAAMLRANVAGTEAMMRAAIAGGAERVVYCSSVAALGLTGDATPADEATPVAPEAIVGVYKRSKYAAERAVRRMIAEEGLQAVIVNPAAPVGPRDIKPTPTGRMIVEAAAGRMPAYLDTGLNIVHVDDVAEGHLLALDLGTVGERYILGGDNLSLAEILGQIAGIVGRSPPKLRLPRLPLFPVALLAEAVGRLSGREPMLTVDALKMARWRMWFSSAKAERVLGYRHRPAEAALADAIAWFKSAGYWS